jgi:hypothetical protein
MSNGLRGRENAHRKGRSHSSHKHNAHNKKAGATVADASAERLFAFTINAKTAEIVKLESLDQSGVRHELSDKEKSSLATGKTEEEIADVVEQVFEAGIACVLGLEESEQAGVESAEDAEIRHMLLAALIQESPAQRLLRPEVLSRAILGTLIRNSIGPNGSQSMRGRRTIGTADSRQWPIDS